MGVFLSTIGAIMIAIATIFSIATRDTLSPGITALTLSLAISVKILQNYF